MTLTDGQTKMRAVGVIGLMLLGALPGFALGSETQPSSLIRQWIETPAQMPAGEAVFATRTSKQFYAKREFQPGWTSGARLSTQATAFLAWLEQLHRYGIDASGYHLESLRALARNPNALTPAQQAQADLLWTDAWLLVASHLYAGRINPDTIDPEWFSNRRDQNFAIALQDALTSNTVVTSLDALHPPQTGYARLVKALAEYRNIANAGGWARISLTGKLEAGSRDVAVTQIRSRLRMTGQLSGDAGSEPDLFDEALRDAVVRFQKQHGLEPDGVIGPQTVEAMNVPVEQRIHQLTLNLERWRWFPQSLGNRHVLVNIAGFDLFVMEGEQPLLNMDVIVGRPYRRTPVFSGNISYMVFNPTWTVPPKLAVQDKLPALIKDPGFLKRENFVVLAPGSNTPLNPEGINWSRLSSKNFPYVLRQNPGPNNALGRVKFMFPNHHNVYLHDTPTHSLFANTRRTFSSGCIRLSKPLKLAELLLSFNPAANRLDIPAVLAGGKETHQRLAEAIPVHLTYWTAWADTDGSIQFRDDIYGRDARLWAALDRKR